MRLLFVEDEKELADLTSRALTRDGFTVDVCETLSDAEHALQLVKYNLAIVDIGLPDGDGLSLVVSMRAAGNQTRVLILTARDSVSDRVNALNAGADDYLIKPFHFEELAARIRALLRRPGEVLGDVLKVANVTLDTIKRTVVIEDRAVELGRREIGLFERLMRGAGRVVSKDWLLDSMYDLNEPVTPNAIEVSIHRLRKSLCDEGANLEITTIRGVGYLLQEARDCATTP